jgi:hypothetical protein
MQLNGRVTAGTSYRVAAGPRRAYRLWAHFAAKDVRSMNGGGLRLFVLCLETDSGDE